MENLSIPERDSQRHLLKILYGRHIIVDSTGSIKDVPVGTNLRSYMVYAVLATTSLKLQMAKVRLSNGYEWEMQPGFRSYLDPKLSDSEFTEIIEDLMIKPPRR